MAGWSSEEYERQQAELEEMHSTYEAMDHAEYVAYMEELDARDAQANGS
ncbi:hypothetical protein AB0919_19335 [Streptomyces sp. NPDC046994]